MKKIKSLILPILLFSIIPIWYFISWDIGFDAADGSWKYSMYHFLDYKRQLLFAMLTLVVVVLLFLKHEFYSGKKRKYLMLSFISLLLFLICHLAFLFFSLHSLANGGIFNANTPAYNPILMDLTLYLQFPSYVVCVVSYLYAVTYLDISKSKAETSN